MLIIAGGVGNIFMVMPKPAVNEAGRDGWILVLLGYGLSIPMGFLIISLSKRFPGLTFVQILPKVIGRIPGKIAGLLYILAWLLMTPIIIWQSIELTRRFLPTTNPLLLVMLLTALIVYSFRKGFENFARTADLIGYIMIFMLSTCLILMLSEVDILNLTPVLEDGPFPVLKGLKVIFPYGLETVLFMSLWLPCLQQRKGIAGAMWIGLAVSGMILTLEVFVTVGFMGVQLTREHTFPVLRVFRYIAIGGFLQGFESIFMLVWVISSYLEIGVFLFQPIIGLAQWFNLRTYKPLIIPIVIITNITGYFLPNIITVQKLDSLKNPILILPMGILITLVWAVAAIRKMKPGKKASI